MIVMIALATPYRAFLCVRALRRVHSGHRTIVDIGTAVGEFVLTCVFVYALVFCLTAL
ncbi:hypothetical protein [Dactylosporangium sp. NPDC000521]|uniref:hypothetical protein n=1 Tax=Dactylosporangium sp. NPDC000521 TaxID=3363975 RepID=UPI003678F4CB